MIVPGIENKTAYESLLKGRRLGLITNHTGVDHTLKSSIDILYETMNLRVLFGPEHGVRGNLEAGVHASDGIDERTGLKVFSLYGTSRAPSEEMLEEIDVLCFDIQDVGARFYTYLWTMVYAMEACQKSNKMFVVFDRPNPVGGERVEGWMLNVNYRSFVGYEPIVQRYGLTIGELAMMANEEYGIHCNLYVIPMLGYQRSMNYRDTGLPWILPSPNIPTAETAHVYLATCLFEGTNLSEGRGTTKPFFLIGAPWLNAHEVQKKMNRIQLEGVLFRTTTFTPFQSKHQGILCHAVELIVTDFIKFEPVKTGLILLDSIRSLHDEFAFLKPYKEGRPPMIDLLTGSSEIRLQTQSLSEVLERMQQDSTVFAKMKSRYHIYE